MLPSYKEPFASSLSHLPQKQHFKLKGARVFLNCNKLSRSVGSEFCTSNQYLHLQTINRSYRKMIFCAIYVLQQRCQGSAEPGAPSYEPLRGHTKCFDSPHCLFLPKGPHCESLTWMQVRPHAISLQSVELFVRLTHHHRGKALTVGLSVMEIKDDACQSRDWEPSRGYRGPDPRVDLWAAPSPRGPAAAVLGMGFLLSFHCLLRSFLF